MTHAQIKIAISIKYLKTGLTVEQYRQKYTELIDDHLVKNQQIFYECLYEETDKHGILHLHGILLAPKSWPRYNLLCKGFNVNHKPVVNEFGWNMYMTNYGKNLPFEFYSTPNANYDPSPALKGYLEKNSK